MNGAALSTPVVIQGGMGVAISGWRLARAVSLAGQLGVVSGTALEVVCARRLQCGDPEGHVRRALSRFPVAAVAEHILTTYFVPGGKQPEAPFRPMPRFTVSPSRALQELTVVANFVEVFLAKEGHDNPVGINFLRKIELSLPFACYGAVLAGVDHVLVGAGSPAELPALLDRLAGHEPLRWPVRVQGATSADGEVTVGLDPRALLGPDLPPLRRPRFDAIVASVDLAQALATDPDTRPDGFVVEGHRAGGHNAPPRGPRRLDDDGQPIYDARDEVPAAAMTEFGLPYWMAGGYGTPEGLAAALADDADGIQAGTVFALCEESGMAAGFKQQLIDSARTGQARVRTDGRASPTGFPFKVADVAGTLSDEQVYRDRPRLCDLAILRSPYRRADGTLGYRCPAEPVDSYVERRGGRAANTVGRRCLCNALLATAGLPQVRPGWYIEPAIVTAGTDFAGVRQLLASVPRGQTYTAAAAVDYLLGR